MWSLTKFPFQEKAKDEIQLPTGTVLYFTQSNEKFKREDIKEGLEKLGKKCVTKCESVGE